MDTHLIEHYVTLLQGILVLQPKNFILFWGNSHLWRWKDGDSKILAFFIVHSLTKRTDIIDTYIAVQLFRVRLVHLLFPFSTPPMTRTSLKTHATKAKASHSENTFSCCLFCSETKQFFCLFGSGRVLPQLLMDSILMNMLGFLSNWISVCIAGCRRLEFACATLNAGPQNGEPVSLWRKIPANRTGTSCS